MMEEHENKASTMTVKTFTIENENVIEELKKIYPNKDKKKKKFVYLDKYEAYKEATDARLHSMERSLNVCYVGLGVVAIWLLLITLTR